MQYHRPLSPEESRRLSLATGILWLITFAASIPALYLFQPVLDDPVGDVAGGDHNTRIFLAATLELITIIANIGTAALPPGCSNARMRRLPSASSPPASWKPPSC